MYRKWIFTLVLTCLLPFGAAGQWHTSNQYHFDNAIQFLPLAMELGLAVYSYLEQKCKAKSPGAGVTA